MHDLIARHQHRIDLIVGSAVTAFGWAIGGLIAVYLLTSLIVGMVDVAAWLGRID